MHVKDLSVVVCNDQPKSYGAPDVLQISLNNAAINRTTEVM